METTMNKREGNIIFDLDGVLAEFREAASIEELFEEGYFLNLEPIKSSIATIKLLLRTCPERVYIASSYLESSDYAYSEKLEWIEKIIPEMDLRQVLLIPSSLTKEEYLQAFFGGISENDLLIDDYSENLKCFSGIPVKFVNPINNKSGKAYKNKISYSDNPILNAFRLQLMASM